MNLGVIYRDGIGVAQNARRAVWYFVRSDGTINRRIASEGLYHLMHCHFEGYGVPESFENGTLCMYAAARAGHPEARERLGIVNYHDTYFGNGEQRRVPDELLTRIMHEVLVRVA